MAKVTFARMGIYTLAFRYALEELGWEVVMPDVPNPRTLSVGVKYAPEFFCVPFKLTLGNFIESLEQGAEMIVTSGGVGPCRAGHYNQVQADICRRLGYQFEMVVLEPVGLYPLHFLRCIRRLNRARRSAVQIGRIIYEGFRKIQIMDEFQVRLARIRPRELKPGTVEPAYDEAVAALDRARSHQEITRARNLGLEALDAVPVDPDRPVLKVGLAGEIYVLLEPAANLDIEKMLGELGVEVHRSIMLSGWTQENAITIHEGTHAKVAARPYLSEHLGGHGIETVGNAVLYAKRGFDGLIQLAPFTCIPEIVARGILPAVNDELDLPFLSFFLDEQTGEAGVRTRVEAFVDMLWQRRHRKEGVAS